MPPPSWGWLFFEDQTYQSYQVSQTSFVETTMSKLATATATAVVALTGAVIFSRLAPEKQQLIRSKVRDARRKVAQIIAPKEDLGDLTGQVNPQILQEIEELCNAVDVENIEIFT